MVLFCSCTWGFHIPESSAAGEWTEDCWKEMSHPTWEKANNFLYPPSQFLQHSFIWDALTVEELSRPNQSALLEAYQLSDWKPMFIDAHFSLSPGAKELVRRLENLEKDAIDPAPYHLKQLQESIRKLEETCSSLELLKPAYLKLVGKIAPAEQPQARSFSSASDFLAYCRKSASAGSDKNSAYTDFLSGLEAKYKELAESASKLDITMTSAIIRLAFELDPFSNEKQVQAFSGQMSMSDLLKSVEPSSPRYQTIHKAYNHYRDAILRKKETPRISAASLRLGDSGKDVGQLQERLREDGFYKGEINAKFDTATLEAVKEFQARHNLEPDGVVGEQAKTWLNIPSDQKMLLLARSLKLLRQSNSRLYDRYIRINTPEFMLEYYKDGKPAAKHRVIVGKSTGKQIKINGQMVAENNTPPISSHIERLIFNPRWYISDRIRKELDASLASDPSIFSRNGYVKMSSTYSWGEPRLFQLPGPKNPLGRIKFEFDNPYAIFIHDTPNKNLFQRSRRDFSHGCVRVDKAIDLAKLLLHDDGNPAAEKTEAFLGRKDQTFVELKTPVPIIIEYIPVTTDEKGHLLFCGDPYGWFKTASKK
jgi:murein L,D-transpeptidase YcbB/YkuD